MRVVHLSVLALALAAAGATAAQARTRDIETSWGKPGVSMTQYRLDAGVCAAKAMTLDISNTNAAQQLVKASDALDRAYSHYSLYLPSANGGIMAGNPWNEVARVRDMYAVDDTLEQVRAIQYQALNDCLTERGYRQFRLTEEQRRLVKKLRLGSDKRRAFLHMLASNPEVLTRQPIS